MTNLAKNGDGIIRGHPAIPAGNYAIELMGKQTGVYDAVFSDDVGMFRPEKIGQFDAICLNNTQGVRHMMASSSRSVTWTHDTTPGNQFAGE